MHGATNSTITIGADGKTLETFGFLDPCSSKILILDRASEDDKNYCLTATHSLFKKMDS